MTPLCRLWTAIWHGNEIAVKNERKAMNIKLSSANILGTSGFQKPDRKNAHVKMREMDF